MTTNLAVTKWFDELNQSTSQTLFEPVLISVCQIVASGPLKTHSNLPASIQIAVHTDTGTAEAKLEFLPIWGGTPTWNLVGQAVCQLIEMIVGQRRTVWSDFDPSCRLTFNVGIAKSSWTEVLTGKTDKIVARQRIGELDDSKTTALLSGSFNPLHGGHKAMADFAEQQLGLNVAFELSVVNADKAPLDFIQIEQRLGQDYQDRSVWLTRAATFERKSKLFPGSTFLVGVDTIERIGSPRFYGNNETLMLQQLEFIAQQGCRFIVFGRINQGNRFCLLRDTRLPSVLVEICEEVPEADFRVDSSSTELRRSE